MCNKSSQIKWHVTLNLKQFISTWVKYSFLVKTIKKIEEKKITFKIKSSGKQKSLKNYMKSS